MDETGLASLATESRNPDTSALDTMTVPELLATMNTADQCVPVAVAKVISQIAAAVELVAGSLRGGGRLIYLGAGTSGRLGLLDAVECPPTFDTDADRVIALIAGGAGAFTAAVEGAEDRADLAASDLDAVQVGRGDTVVGLAASGRTPYVIAGLAHARACGATTVSVACNVDAAISAHADVAIEVDTGPEVLTGSTRLKAGTAQKLVCNMISTAAMVQTGRVYENLMIDMRPTNDKLADRAERIVAAATDVPPAIARAALADAGGSAKVAVVALLADVSAAIAADALTTAGGSVRSAVRSLIAPSSAPSPRDD